GWDLIFGDTVGAAAGAAATGTGAWALAPYPTGSSIIASWLTLPVGTAPNTIPPIEIDLEETLIHDVACFKFIVKNNDGIAHSVGLRFAQEIPGPLNLPIQLPDGRLICTETLLTGINMPESWRGFGTGGTFSFGGILRGHGVDPSLTQADELA